MAHAVNSAEPGAPPQSPARAAGRRGFFFWTAVLLFVLLLVGFAPSFFLRVVFDGPPIAWHLHVHGIVLTSWYGWLVLQTGMIRYGRIATHRRLGVAGIALGAAVCVAGPLATVNLVSSLQAEGLDWSTDMSVLPRFGIEGMTMEQFAGFVVFANLGSIVAFATLLLAAVLLRHKARSHKRLMLLASIALFPPVLARLSRWPVFGGEDGPFIPLTLLVLLLTVVVHDFVATRRVHRATLAGVGVIIVTAVAGQVLSGTAFGAGVVRALA